MKLNCNTRGESTEDKEETDRRHSMYVCQRTYVIQATEEIL